MNASTNPRSTGSDGGSLHVLAVEPFYGGSHFAYLDGVFRHSRHRWSLLAGTPVHWKWRMRSASLELATQLPTHLWEHGHPDVIWSSEMLDLPQWLGIATKNGLEHRPSIVYFHENQWTYPQSPGTQTDLHYGYTNLLTSIAADVCLFNSEFHRDDFLRASEEFIRRMPDAKACHDFSKLKTKCDVVYPGFESTSIRRPERDGVLNIGWVARWEHDKRPDLFVELLRSLHAQRVRFRLILLGARPREGSPELDVIRAQWAEQILFDRYAESRREYLEQLAKIDVVVSTADHEFFGIAICEAIDAGAVAVVPNRLSYPEVVATPTRYESIDHAGQIIQGLTDESSRLKLATEGQRHIARFRMAQTVAELDVAIENLHNQLRCT